MASKIKADSAAIRKYVETLKVYAEHGASHEGATETAFSNLLASTAKPHGWTLIPKKKKVVGKKVNIYPDGTLQDIFKLARRYWEGKDTEDGGPCSASRFKPFDSMELDPELLDSSPVPYNSTNDTSYADERTDPGGGNVPS